MSEHREVPKSPESQGEPPKGRPLAVDWSAESADPKLPAFLAPPAGAPVYHGFPVMQDVEVDGFIFGKITDFEAEPDTVGDAFVIAPDNSRAGLVWEVSEDSYFEEVCPIEEVRWGVWGVTFPFPMTTREDARRNLEHILPLLKEKWQMWRDRYGMSNQE